MDDIVAASDERCLADGQPNGCCGRATGHSVVPGFGADSLMD
jgi:hypothetical protein